MQFTESMNNSKTHVPTISVITPVYNGARFLEETIESILAQTFTDFEYILIDDGSSDTSYEIMQRYAAQDSRIRIVSRENKGMAETRNEGVHLARAEIIAFQDHDDIALPHRLEKQLACMKETGAAAVGGGLIIIDEEGTFQREKHVPSSHDAILKGALSGTCYNPTCTLMIKKETVQSVGFFRSEYIPSDDYDLLLRVIVNTIVCNTKDFVIKYRVFNENTTHKKALQMIKVAFCARYRTRHLLDSSEINSAFLRNPSSLEALRAVAKGYEQQFWTEYLLEVLPSKRIPPSDKTVEVRVALHELTGHGCAKKRKIMSQIMRLLPDSFFTKMKLLFQVIRL